MLKIWGLTSCKQSRNPHNPNPNRKPNPKPNPNTNAYMKVEPNMVSQTDYKVNFQVNRSV